MKKDVYKFKTLAVYGERVLLYKKGKIYIANTTKMYKADFVLRIPYSFRKRLFVKFRLMERLMRLEPRLAIPINSNEFILSCGGNIYRIDVDKKELHFEFKLRATMNNPLMFAKKSNGNILFGDYFSNNKHEEVSIYERFNGDWKKVYTFAAGLVYHIHGIVIDEKKIFILTGDSDSESGIWYTNDNFKNVEKIVGGSQKYRTCVAFPYDGGLIYATDTPLEQNFLYFLKKTNNIFECKKIGELPGPCIYGTRINDNFYFATSVEPDARLKSSRYRFTYKLGPGVKDRYTHIYCYNSKNELSEVCNFKKDCFPMLLFQFGNCMFPNVELNDKLWFCPVSVKKYDGKTIILND